MLSSAYLAFIGHVVLGEPASSITAGGLVSALGVEAGIGAIVGGAAAVFSKK